MTYVYRISTCTLFENGASVGKGYSGFNEYANDPTKVSEKAKGPIPPGEYTIGPAYTHPHLGPVCMNLEPDPRNEMFGRSLFRIHGDNSTPAPFDGSHGCLVFSRAIRERVAASENRRLEVFP